MKITFALGFLLFALSACTENPQTENQDIQTTPAASENTEEESMTQDLAPMEYVVLETNKGNISLELDPNRAPATVKNFLEYVDAGHYNGTVFHRVIDGFMIQGGGFTPSGEQRPTNSPIVLESNNNLKNNIGTIAMARTNAPNSATAQFFININDNDFLNYSPGNPGYAVFGKVSSGMDVVNEIRQVKTGVKNGMQDWPVEPVIIEKAYRE